MADSQPTRAAVYGRTARAKQKQKLAALQASLASAHAARERLRVLEEAARAEALRLRDEASRREAQRALEREAAAGELAAAREAERRALVAAAEADEARAADGNKLAELLAALELQSKPVQAPWLAGDGCYYQGVVQRVGGDGAVDVRFDDGDVGRGVKVASLRDYDTPYSDEDSDNSEDGDDADAGDEGDGLAAVKRNMAASLLKQKLKAKLDKLKLVRIWAASRRLHKLVARAFAQLHHRFC